MKLIRYAISALAIALVSAVLLYVGAEPRSSRAANGDWPTYLHDSGRSAANLDESLISPVNAPQLFNAWSFTTGGFIAASPTVVGGVVYVGSWDGYMYAIDAQTHAQKWKSPFLGQTTPDCAGATGITSTATVDNGVVYVGGGGQYWYALNASTGSILWQVYTGDNNGVTGGHYNWSSPLIYNGFAYIGIASFCDSPLVQGQLLQVNLTTHLVTHTFNVVPNGQAGGGVWSSPSVDTATNRVFITTGNEGPQSGQIYARAIIALDGDRSERQGLLAGSGRNHGRRRLGNEPHSVRQLLERRDGRRDEQGRPGVWVHAQQPCRRSSLDAGDRPPRSRPRVR